MAGQMEELARPLAVIDGLFAQHAAGRASGTRLASEWGERDHFARALGLDDEEQLARIPCLNDVSFAYTIPPFCLVRYRGFVQDVFEPEVYAAVFEEHGVENG